MLLFSFLSVFRTTNTLLALFGRVSLCNANTPSPSPEPNPSRAEKRRENENWIQRHDEKKLAPLFPSLSLSTTTFSLITDTRLFSLCLFFHITCTCTTLRHHHWNNTCVFVWEFTYNFSFLLLLCLNSSSIFTIVIDFFLRRLVLNLVSAQWVLISVTPSTFFFLFKTFYSRHLFYFCLGFFYRLWVSLNVLNDILCVCWKLVSSFIHW